MNIIDNTPLNEQPIAFQEFFSENHHIEDITPTQLDELNRPLIYDFDTFYLKCIYFTKNENWILKNYIVYGK